MGGQPCNNNCRSPLLPLKRNPKHERAAAPYSGASWFDYCALFYGILKNPMLAPYIVGVSGHTAKENPRSQMDAKAIGGGTSAIKGSVGRKITLGNRLILEGGDLLIPRHASHGLASYSTFIRRL